LPACPLVLLEGDDDAGSNTQYVWRKGQRG
jgi:hypothetical protein